LDFIADLLFHTRAGIFGALAALLAPIVIRLSRFVQSDRMAYEVGSVLVVSVGTILITLLLGVPLSDVLVDGVVAFVVGLFGLIWFAVYEGIKQQKHQSSPSSRSPSHKSTPLPSQATVAPPQETPPKEAPPSEEKPLAAAFSFFMLLIFLVVVVPFYWRTINGITISYMTNTGMHNVSPPFSQDERFWIGAYTILHALFCSPVLVVVFLVMMVAGFAIFEDVT
jgi:hypothetical protein